MNTVLPPLPLFLAFLVASFALAITPGPGVLYIVTRSLGQGRKAGLASVAGVALGNLGNALGASLGLAALFAVSSTAFTIVKFAGAFYLFALGISTLRNTGESASPSEMSSPSATRILRDGFLVALLNPKTTLFFAAFLPQFLGEAAGTPVRCLTLGVLFVLIAATTDSLYAMLAGFIAPFLKNMKSAGSLGRYVSGTIYMGLGLLTACAGSKSK